MIKRSSLPPMDEYIAEISDIWESHWLTKASTTHAIVRNGLPPAFCDIIIDEKESGQVLTLPIYASFDEGQIDYISERSN